MDEEKIEVQDNVEQVKKGFDFKKIDFKNIDFKNLDYKKYIPYVGIVLAVIVVIAILVSVLGGGPKKTVKAYISGMNSRNAKKVIKNVDFTGISVWEYNYDADDFSSNDYKEFIQKYKDMDKKEIKDAQEKALDAIDDLFDDMKDEYKSFKIKVEEFKKVDKLGKNLYAVKAKVAVKAKPKDKNEDELDESTTMTFVVYKNKLVSLGELSLMY